MRIIAILIGLVPLGIWSPAVRAQTAASAFASDAVDELDASQSGGLGLEAPPRTSKAPKKETTSQQRELAPDKKSITPQKKHRQKRRAKRRRRRARRGFVQMTAVGPGYELRDRHRGWGMALTVQRLEETMADYHRRFPLAVPVRICDISRRWGGRFRPHRSHRKGTDVDIKLVMKRPRKTWIKASGRTMATERVWFLVHRLVRTGDVKYIFLDRRLQRALYRFARSRGYSKEYLAPILSYPRRNTGVVRHWRGHADHLHVRFFRRRTQRTVQVAVAP